MSPLDKTVLVVEDNDIEMRLFTALLEAHGYTVLQAMDGIEGWRMAREHRPDLILMDIQLPKVSGLEVTKWLKDDETPEVDPGDRDHDFRDGWRQRKNSGRRLRRLYRQADFSFQILADRRAFR